MTSPRATLADVFLWTVTVVAIIWSAGMAVRWWIS